MLIYVNLCVFQVHQLLEMLKRDQDTDSAYSGEGSQTDSGRGASEPEAASAAALDQGANQNNTGNGTYVIYQGASQNNTRNKGFTRVPARITLAIRGLPGCQPE